MQHTPTLITSQFGKLLKADAESMPCVRKSAAAGTHLEETRDRVSFTFGEGCVQTQRARRMTGCRGCFGECAAKIRELEAASEIIVIVNIRKILLFLPLLLLLLFLPLLLLLLFLLLLLLTVRVEPSGVQVSILSPASHNGSLLPAEPAPNLHSNNPNLRPPSSAAPKKHPKCGAIFSIHASLLFFRCQQQCF